MIENWQQKAETGRICMLIWLKELQYIIRQLLNIKVAFYR